MTNKSAIVQHFDQLAPQRSRWFQRNQIYHQQIIKASRPFIDADSRVLELGCSTGDLLHALNVRNGVGVDISPRSIEIARARYPEHTWICADVDDLPETAPFDQPFDVIMIVDLMGYIGDIQQTLQKLHRLTHSRTRLVISVWNWLWQPILELGETLGLKAPDIQLRQNWLSASAMINFLELANYETVQVQPGLLLPYHIPPISTVINSFSNATLLNVLTLLTTVIARPAPAVERREVSVTVMIPTRNEIENIPALIARTPEMGTHTELLFVDGNSTDGTVEKIHAEIAVHPERDIKFMPQVPPRRELVSSDDHDPDNTPPDLMLKLGKGDAVRKGFEAASGDIIMILDSDISVPPEEMTKFYDALVEGKARLINGTRFIYRQERGAMRPLNLLGNVFFSKAFSWLLGQPVTDTLCGTKAMYRRDYLEIAANRSYFGDFDPFGDFDLLFGASRLRYRIIDLPVHYLARTYGTSKVRVSTHGPLLIRMSLFALWQLKLRPWLNGEQAASRNISPTVQGKNLGDLERTDQTGIEPGYIALALGLMVLLLWALVPRRHKP